MKKMIQNLRRQSEDTRSHILHIVMFFAILLLIGLWILSLGKDITDPNTKKKIAEDIDAFTPLTENIVNSYDGVL